MHNQQAIVYIKSYYFLLNVFQLKEKHCVFFSSSLSGKWNKWNYSHREGDGEPFQDLRFCNVL